jgi:hypothetical protein
MLGCTIVFATIWSISFSERHSRPKPPALPCCVASRNGPVTDGLSPALFALGQVGAGGTYSRASIARASRSRST